MEMVGELKTGSYLGLPSSGIQHVFPAVGGQR